MTLTLIALFVANVLLSWYADQLAAQKIPACAGVADDRFVRNSESCNAYYSCRDQLAEEAFCPGAFLFEAVTQTCDIATNVDCTLCSPFGVQNLEDPSDRHKYYKCVTGVRTHRTCGQGLAFDTRIGDCNLESTVPVKQAYSPTLILAPWQKLGTEHNQAAPGQQQQSFGNQNPPPWQIQQQKPEQQNFNSIPWQQQQPSPNPAPWQQQQQQQQQPQPQNSNNPPWQQQQQSQHQNPNQAPWQQQPSNNPSWQQQPQSQKQQQTTNNLPWQQQPQQQQQHQTSNNLPWQQQPEPQKQTISNPLPWQNHQQHQTQNNNPWGQPQQQQQLPDIPNIQPACEVPTGYSPIEGSATRYNYCLNGDVKWEMRCDLGSYFSRSERRCVLD